MLGDCAALGKLHVGESRGQVTASDSRRCHKNSTRRKANEESWSRRLLEAMLDRKELIYTFNLMYRPGHEITQKREDFCQSVGVALL